MYRFHSTANAGNTHPEQRIPWIITTKLNKFSLALLLFAVTGSDAVAQGIKSYWGKYEGELLLQPLSGSGRMKILKEYSFVDSAGGR